MTTDPTAKPDPKARLLSAARDVLSQHGIAGLTLRAIARQAGVSHGAPLRHYPNLPALVAALSTRGFRDLIAEIERSTARAAGTVDSIENTEGAGDTPTARSLVTRAGSGYVRFALAQPDVFALMFRTDLCDTSDPDYQAAAAASFNQLAELVRNAQAEGWRPDDPTDHLAAVLWAQVHGLAQLWLHGALQAVVEPAGLDTLIALATER